MNQGSSVKIDAATSNLMDALRGVSALIVACVHAFQVFLLPYFGLGSLSHILTSLMATHAVTMFFIVSGFMIYISTLRHRNTDGSFQSMGIPATCRAERRKNGSCDTRSRARVPIAVNFPGSTGMAESLLNRTPDRRQTE
jgi:hypothetical protein